MFSWLSSLVTEYIFIIYYIIFLYLQLKFPTVTVEHILIWRILKTFLLFTSVEFYRLV